MQSQTCNIWRPTIHGSCCSIPNIPWATEASSWLMCSSMIEILPQAHYHHSNIMMACYDHHIRALFFRGRHGSRGWPNLEGLAVVNLSMLVAAPKDLLMQGGSGRLSGNNAKKDGGTGIELILTAIVVVTGVWIHRDILDILTQVQNRQACQGAIIQVGLLVSEKVTVLAQRDMLPYTMELFDFVSLGGMIWKFLKLLTSASSKNRMGISMPSLKSPSSFRDRQRWRLSHLTKVLEHTTHDGNNSVSKAHDSC